jgi:hypothetical protein
MAKKKKKLSRKQRAQQRREAIARKRRETGWTPPQPRSQPQNQGTELLDDMLPLFPMVDDPADAKMNSYEQLMLTLLDSGHLIEEPEFEEIIVDPMQAVDTLTQVGEELDLDPETLSRLPAGEQEEAQMTLLEATTRRLLTDKLRQDIIQALNELRLRLKGAGKQKESAQAAALQMFLDSDESEEMWPTIGLVQAIVQRSLAVGFEFFEASAELMEAGDQSPLTMLDKLSQSRLGRRTEGLLKKVPGLSGYLEKQADKIWEEGTDAIFDGELSLELFTPDELMAGSEIFKTIFTGDGDDDDDDDEGDLEITEETGKALITQIDNYITELFTPERLEQLRARLKAIVDDPAYDKKWLAFFMMLNTYLTDEDAVENEKPFLIKTFFGEMRHMSEELIEEEEAYG